MIRYTCVHCHSKLEESDDINNAYTCSLCNLTYPVVAGIPVLVNNTVQYLTESYCRYKKHISNNWRHRNRILERFEKDHTRQNVAYNISHAIAHNNGIIEPLLAVLRPYVSIDELVENNMERHNSNPLYLKDLTYLRRDWSWMPEGEAQLATLLTTLRALTQEHDQEKENLLVLGAGLGRIAWELSPDYQQVLCTDLSFSMAYFFHQVQKELIPFYDIQTNNIAWNTHATRLLKATVQAPGAPPPAPRENISYFVSDVMQTPLPDANVSCILSVYFTDVLSLKLYIDEVCRVLKTGGIFVHIGPLGYPFNDESGMLSAEDIKILFTLHGFEVLEDKFVPAFHQEVYGTLHADWVQNWVFAAIKRQPSARERASAVNSNSVLALKEEVSFEVRGKVNITGMNIRSYCFTTAIGKTYENAEFMVDAFKWMDGKRSVGEVIQQLAAVYEMTDPGLEEKLTGKFRQLVIENVLTIISIE